MLQVEHPYVYVFLREDLSFPQKIVQAGHALLEIGKIIPPDLPHPSVIVLSIKNENKINSIELMLKENNIQYKVFCEPDLNNQKTALATEPIFGEKRKLFKKYQLLKEHKNEYI